MSGCSAKCCESRFLTAINSFRDEINTLKDWHFSCGKRRGYGTMKHLTSHLFCEERLGDKSTRRTEPRISTAQVTVKHLGIGGVRVPSPTTLFKRVFIFCGCTHKIRDDKKWYPQ